MKDFCDCITERGKEFSMKEGGHQAMQSQVGYVKDFSLSYDY